MKPVLDLVILLTVVNRGLSATLATGTSVLPTGNDPAVTNFTCGNANCSTDISPEYEDSEMEEEWTEPPLWCPDGYGLARNAGVWMHFCRPKPCAEFPLNATTDGFPNGTMVTVDERRSTVRACARSLSPAFRTCSAYRSLSHAQYDVLANGSLSNRLNGEQLPLGEYWLRGTVAVVCGPDDGTVARPRSCMAFRVADAAFRLLPERTLFVDRIQRTVAESYFSVNGSVASVCVEMDPAIEECQDYIPMEAEHIRLRPNMDLLTTLGSEVVYPLGHYLLTVDNSLAWVCHEPGHQVRAETLSLYGIVASVSAFCLLLALVAHVFFPNLNYHTKALLCLAFSLFVMYLSMAVRYLGHNVHFSPAGNVTIFVFQYTFALSAFFWLSVISYDLWKVFSELQGTINAGKKRVFLAKCAYAFGIPALMCILVVSISFSPNVQTSLGLHLRLDEINWFTDPLTYFIFFYLPILVILIENVVFFALTVYNLRKASSGTDIVNKKINRKLFMVYLKLFLVMGIFWFYELISWLTRSETDESAWYFTDVINCLQGVFIFLIYVCKRRTLLIIKNKLGYISDNRAEQSTSSTKESERKISAISMANLQRKEASNDYTKM